MLSRRPTASLSLALALLVLGAPLARADVLPIAPVLGTPAATTTSDSATVSTLITPGALAMTWAIAYGLDGEATTVQTPPVAQAAGLVPVPVAATLQGLAADGTYHYHFVASTLLGTVTGPDHVFVTETARTSIGDEPPATPTPVVPDPGAVVAPVEIPAATPPTTTPRASLPMLTLSRASVSGTATRRSVRVTTHAAQAVTLRIEVRRGGSTVQHRTIAAVAAGTRAFTVRIPGTLVRGRLVVRVTAVTAAGERSTVSQTVVVTAPRAHA